MNTPTHLVKAFEEYRQRQVFTSEPGQLYEPVNYILDLGGKRVRPVLTLMGCELFGGKPEEALPAAFAMELFHNFTLVHDDIMDDASMRRGRATVHKKYSSAQAILSGDVMMIHAYEFLNRLETSKFRKAFDLFNATAIRVCEGQQYDINFQSSGEIAVKEYISMIELKTAELLACSLTVGAIVADADEEGRRHLFEFGRNVGICFQILDDLLDSFGDEATFGKKIGGDIIQNKKTYLYLKSLELSGQADKEKLKYYFQNNVPVDEKVKNVIQIYRERRVDVLARDEARNYHDLAFRSLDAIRVPELNKQPLREFAAFMLERIV